ISKVDIFQNLKTSLSALNQKYHMIIIDPPNLTASEKDKEKAKKTYKRLITETLPFLKRDGILIMCSCSNRIKEEDFMANSISTFKEYHLKYKLLDKLKEEIDHPCNPLFPEGKYFKVHIFRIY
ncbi:MAG: hypothetical protein KDK45_25760, partial [Leptospiraceae bacterium]|nr:hypothetical protein [Leptospiraceae bacterium]